MAAGRPQFMQLAGYTQVARLDRRTGQSQGGIILFVKRGFEQSIVHIGDYEVHKAFLVHCSFGISDR